MRNVNPYRSDRWTNDERRVTGVRIRKYLMGLIGLYTANGSVGSVIISLLWIVRIEILSERECDVML